MHTLWLGDSVSVSPRGPRLVRVHVFGIVVVVAAAATAIHIVLLSQGLSFTSRSGGHQLGLVS